MGNAILKRMGQGYPGDISRKSEATVESGLCGADLAYGAPVILKNGKFAPVEEDTEAIYGFLARPYPTQEGQGVAGSIQDVMRRGYMTVKLASGTAAKGGTVYVRITAATGKAVGDIETTEAMGTVADGEGTKEVAETIALENCFFMGEADQGGNVEISFNL